MVAREMDNDADFPLPRGQAKEICRVALQFLVEFEKITRVAVGRITLDADIPRLIWAFRRYDAGARIGLSLTGCCWHWERARDLSLCGDRQASRVAALWAAIHSRAKNLATAKAEITSRIVLS